jgi:hypothetical protein
LDTPKVYQYKSDYNGVKSYIYQKLTKINYKTLLFEQYTDSFKLFTKIILEYTQKGAKYKEYWILRPPKNDNLYKISILDSISFPFNLKDSPAKYKSEEMFNDETKITTIVKRYLSEPKDTVINNLRVKIIHGQGDQIIKISLFKLPHLNDEIITKEFVIYQKGIGIILIRSYGENGSYFKMELDKILTNEEFEQKKLAR